MADPGLTPSPAMSTCNYCGDDFPTSRVAKLVCKCCYCDGCLEKMFAESLSDMGPNEGYHYRPSCCTGRIPFATARRHLSFKLAKSYAARKLEIKTKDRTYCHSCEKFIAPHSIHNGQAICQICRADTCSKCKEKWHFGPCWGGAMREILELAKQEHWKQCPGCRSMVEKISGCPYMRCICGCGFCYLCGETDPCTCGGVEDDNGWDQAEEEAPGFGVITDPEPQSAGEIHLQNGHSRYVDVNWRGRAFTCGLCDTSYRNWIGQCRDCALHVCNRCRRRGWR